MTTDHHDPATTADELDRLRIIAENFVQLARAASSWRAQYVPQVGPANEPLFRPAELALIRAVDATPAFVIIEGFVAEVFPSRCECRACAVDLIVEAPGHCISWHGNRLHTCAALDAFDEAQAAEESR